MIWLLYVGFWFFPILMISIFLFFYLFSQKGAIKFFLNILLHSVIASTIITFIFENDLRLGLLIGGGWLLFFGIYLGVKWANSSN